MKKDFLEITDLTKEEIFRLFDLARYYRSRKREQKCADILANRMLGLVFRKPSTRTRVSFEVAVHQLGGHSLYLAGESTQISRGESVKDTASVLSRYLDGLVIRTFGHDEITEYAKHATVPVINALTDQAHPCQALADYFTVYDRRGTLDGVKVVYIGHANNVCNSLLLGAAVLGVKIGVVAPPGFGPSADVVRKMSRPELLTTGDDPVAFVRDADVIYTDTWVSMGEEREREQRMKTFSPYQVNAELLGRAKPSAIFMHCLPAHRGAEVTDDVLDGPQSVVMDQAENRLHCQTALLHWLFGG